MEGVMRFSSICSLLLVGLLFLSGCSTKSFLVMEDGPKGYSTNQTLGVRAGVDTGSLSPTERYSWLEVCDRVEVPTFFGLFSETHYVNCEVATNHMAQAARTTTTGYIAGVVGPVIQTGLTAGAVAYTGHMIGKGIGRSGDNIQTTTTNTSSSSGGVANGGSATAKGGTSLSYAEGGQGGKGGSVIGSGNSSSKSYAEADADAYSKGGSVGNISATNTNSPSFTNSPTYGPVSGGSIGSGAVQMNQNVNSGAANGHGVINVGGHID
jgi:hypothetical protein